MATMTHASLCVMNIRHDGSVWVPHDPLTQSGRRRGRADHCTAREELEMSDEHIRGSISQAQGAVEHVIGTLTRDKRMRQLGKARHVQGTAQKGLGDVQDALGGTRHVLNLVTIVGVLLGALVLVAVRSMVGGGNRIDRSDLGAGI
jgi:uncharacterized protein YjbJ (UPF0337 family)